MGLPENAPATPQDRPGVRRALPLVSDGDQGGTDRRDFLKLVGFAIAGGALGGCQRAEVRHSVPPLTPPEDFVPGQSYEYSSTCGGCSAGCGLVFKSRDGRPVKLEGNPEHPLSRGGLCAAGQASLLGLYDQQRLQAPSNNGHPADWSDVDRELTNRLETIRKEKGAVRFLTGPGVGPATRAAIKRFLDTFPPGARHVVYDPRSCSAILEAHARTHGARLLPHYHLDRAAVIVGFDADFLGTWISPVEFTAAYQAGRRLEGASGRPSYHVQFESLLTLTGSKADERRCVAPGELAAVMSHLAARLLARKAKDAGEQVPDGPEGEPPVSARFLDHLAEHLWQNRDREHSLILCGSQDVELQVLTNYLNHLLGNYGITVDIAQPSYQREDNDSDVEALLRELRDGEVSALVIHRSNPVHDLPGGEQIAEALKRVPLVVSLSPRSDETAQLAHFACPDHHSLESWGDAEPVNGIVSLVQPAIDPLFKTRSVLESLAAWAGKPRAAYELLREHWEKEVFPRAGGKGSFAEFWDRTLHDGFAVVAPKPVKADSFDAAVRVAPQGSHTPEGTHTLVLYPKVGMPDSSHAYNPWLHELPDPISKVTWDNYACVSSATAAKLGLSDGDMVRLDGGEEESLDLPVLVQVGQHDSVVGVALGYGSVLTRRFANIGPRWLQSNPTVGPNGLVGKNAAPMLKWADGSLHFTRDGVRLTKIARQHPLATTQSYSLLTVPPRFAWAGHERRDIIKESTLKDYQQQLAQEPGAETSEKKEALWPADHPDGDYQWGMVIDLNACTGCSACVIACQAENNIPVVGKDEVRRHREMHWLRVDRYYTERDSGVDVAHQPMLCQHCGNAPCEVVCPVLATVHNDEGLNQQVYNRCVGTRYCANNCPYKVRRFNWFDYAHDDLLHNLVLNPDVTVRSRGVMEKCTFCVQRIQDGKSAGGDHVIQTACQQSCPARAIVFGNLKDPASRVAKLAASRRGYQVLGELNVKPSVSYLGLVRNRPAEGTGE